MQHNRNVESAERRLWAHLRAQPPAATMQVQVPRQAGQQARTVILSIRFTPVTVFAPLLKEQQPSLSLWAIEAAELHPPKGVKPILWQLLTTLPVTEAAQAMERIGWYSQRWQIEVLHKVLKSGCNVEQRQLETVPRLKRALMLDLILSWRIMYLSKVLREYPDQLASAHLTEAEWKILWCKFHRTRTAPSVAHHQTGRALDRPIGRLYRPQIRRPSRPHRFMARPSPTPRPRRLLVPSKLWVMQRVLCRTPRRCRAFQLPFASKL